jgi:hypothetical protein
LIEYDCIETKKIFDFLCRKERRKRKKYYDFFTGLLAKYKNPEMPIIKAVLNYYINDKSLSYRDAARLNMENIVQDDSGIYKKFLKNYHLAKDIFTFDKILTDVLAHI